MPPISRTSKIAPAIASLCLTKTAFAAPGGSDLDKVGGAVSDYLIWTLGPTVFILGLVMAAYSLFISGDDRGVRRGMNVVIAGAVLFAAPSIVDFVKSAVR